MTTTVGTDYTANMTDSQQRHYVMQKSCLVVVVVMHILPTISKAMQPQHTHAVLEICCPHTIANKTQSPGWALQLHKHLMSPCVAC